MELLLHACCAPCAVACVDCLREEGRNPALFWYNPNIHPFGEYRNRRESLVEFAANLGERLILKDYYGLGDFVAANTSPQERCGYCYRTRMEQSARYAAGGGFSAFTTTLLISPYQNHRLIIDAGEEAGKKFGVSFLYRDFRPLFKEGQGRARALGLYAQKYCGCIFSEEERYRKQIDLLQAKS